MAEDKRLKKALNKQCEGRYREAEELYLRILRDTPNDFDANRLIATNYAEQGQVDEALHYFVRAVTIDPNQPTLQCLAADFYMQKDLREQAYPHYQKAMQLDPRMTRPYYGLGYIFWQSQRFDEAEHYCRLALQLDPDYADVCFALGSVLKERGRNSEAVEYLKKARALDASVLDLGCGTGLCGQEFRQAADHLTGIDIAPKMIVEVQKKQLYDELHASDIIAFLERTERRYDLFIAADVFVYVGALEQVFTLVRAKALPRACFIFSVEHADGDGFRLTSSVRYAHSRAYIEALAPPHGFTIQDRQPVGIRKERGEWIQGELYRLQLS